MQSYAFFRIDIEIQSLTADIQQRFMSVAW